MYHLFHLMEPAIMWETEYHGQGKNIEWNTCGHG